jgi:Ca-activated chloride channel family protein
VTNPVRGRLVQRRHVFGAIAGAVLVGVAAIPTVWPSTVCEPTAIEVSSSTEKAGVMEELVARYNAADRVVNGLCAQVTLTALTSGAMKNDIAAGRADPDVWLPTSSMWLQLLEHDGLGHRIAQDVAPRSIATSTLVIALPEPVAAALDASGAPLDTWADVLTLAQQGWSTYGESGWGEFILGRDNAETSTSGLAATVATYIAAPGDITQQPLDDPAVVEFVHGIESSVLRYGDEAVRFMREIYDAEQIKEPQTYRPEVDAIVIQEQMAYLYNRGAPDGDPASVGDEVRARYPLRVVHPADGTLQLDHPFVVLASATPDQRTVAEDFYDFLVSDAQQRRFAELGFRSRDNAVRPTEQLVQTLGLPANQNLQFVAIPDRELLAAMVDSWDNVRRRARVLLVLDVSGSMNEIVDDPLAVNDLTKLQHMIPAVRDCALGRLDDDDEVGLWTFSSDPAYTEVAPVSRLGDVRDELVARIEGLTASGNTALYEVIANASRMMAQTADPERINAVVLLSDGQNTEQYPGDAQALLADLAGQETPVRIFTVPYGQADNADIPLLAEIARLTKAAQYDVRDPLDACGAFVRVFRNFG